MWSPGMVGRGSELLLRFHFLNQSLNLDTHYCERSVLDDPTALPRIDFSSIPSIQLNIRSYITTAGVSIKFRCSLVQCDIAS
jgi:hypothetical protein